MRPLPQTPRPRFHSRVPAAKSDSLSVSSEELSSCGIDTRLGKSEDASRMLYARAMPALTMRMAGHGGGS